jgi:hypothetical protein
MYCFRPFPLLWSHFLHFLIENVIIVMHVGFPFRVAPAPNAHYALILPEGLSSTAPIYLQITSSIFSST